MSGLMELFVVAFTALMAVGLATVLCLVIMFKLMEWFLG